MRSWSITRRLIFFYTLSACITLVLAAGFLYWALARNVAQEGHQFLIDKINVLRLSFPRHPSHKMTDLSSSSHVPVTNGAI